MLLVLVALVVAQAEQDAPAASPVPAEPPPAWLQPPGSAPEPEPAERPTVSSKPPSTASRAVFTGLGAVGGSAAGLGVTLLLAGSNPSLDTTFSTAMLSALLMSGVGFTVHQSMGGRGEIMLALLSSAVVMGAAGAGAHAIDRTAPASPILTTLLGTVPAAALLVLSLEATTPERRRVHALIAPAPGGGAMVLLGAQL